MLQSPALQQSRVRNPIGTPIWLIVGGLGWAGVVVLASRMFAQVPPTAGYDLELLLDAGRRVAAGVSPYDAAIVAGQVPLAEGLFYSYPPPVAQFFSLFAAVPSNVMLVAWSALAILGVGIVATALARRLAVDGFPDVGTAIRLAALPTLAIVPFVNPFTISILFGNADAAFPLAYGLMLLGAIVDRPSARFAAGASLAIVSIAKLHPASLAIWFLIRGLAERQASRAAPAVGTDGPPGDGRLEPLTQSGLPGSGRLRAAGRWGSWRSLAEPRSVPRAWRVLSAAVAVGLVILTASLVAGGLSPWRDYIAVARAASSADLIDLRNVGPASQIAGLLGGTEGLAHSLQILVSLAALGVTAWAAWFRRDPIESFGWAAAASLVILPVTWFHYPVALLPVAIASVVRAARGRPRKRVVRLLVASLLIAALSLGLPVAVWLSVALVILAARASAPGSTTSDVAPAARSLPTTAATPTAAPAP